MKPATAVRGALWTAAAALLLLQSPPGARTSPADSLRNEEGGEKIVVQSKTVGPLYILARPNVGPYNAKRLGPVFDEVSAFARGRGVSGPMIGLYYDDSRRVPPDVQKSDIGILLPAKIELTEADHPFYVKTFAPHEVAYVRVRGPFRDVPKSYKIISEWAWKNGYRIVHPVKEIYSRKPTVDQDDETLVTEVQFTLERAPTAGR